MLNTMEKTIIIKSLCIRQERGEKPEDVLETWPNLTDAEKAEVLAEVTSVSDVK